MSKVGSWRTGRETIRDLCAKGKLERVAPNRAFADEQIRMAREALDAAQLTLVSSPRASFTLSYDAARLALTAMLLNQGLRTGRGEGGHATLGHAAVAQLGQGTKVFDAFDSMRRMRNDSEYPMPDSRGDVADSSDAEAAIPRARAIIDAVAKVLDVMPVWSG